MEMKDVQANHLRGAVREASGLGTELSRAHQRLVRTTDAAWPAILRLTLGGVMLPHAAQKTLGLFGGGGYAQTMHWFTASLRLPTALAVLVIVIEQVASLALILGLFTRAAAAGIGLVMLGAVFTVHLRNGFFMNWYGTQAGEGFEFLHIGLHRSPPAVGTNADELTEARSLHASCVRCEGGLA